MKYVVLLVLLWLVVLGCGNTTGPAEEVHAWESFDWILVADMLSDYYEISYATHGDSIFVVLVQKADTSSYFTSNLPDIISLDILYPNDPEPYQIDGIRALTATGLLLTDDWYAYDDPFGLGNDPKESIPFQPDTSLGGSNDVRGVFLGQVNNDSTVVFRRALRTVDIQHDAVLLHDSTYSARIYLQWGECMEPGYNYWETEIFQITI